MEHNRKYVFALGFFDGVHLGHQALLAACCRLAEETGMIPAAITFQAHPMALLRDDSPALISTEADRKRLLCQYGMKRVISLPLTMEVMSTPWETFLHRLVEEGAMGFVCGDDFHFGNRGLGDGAKLRDFCTERGLPCVIVPEQTLDGRRISSSYIRTQLETGDMATAVRFLGHPYILTGTVVPGQQLGRRLGIPTANLRLEPGLVVPKFGVYACTCLVRDKCYPAVTSIGVRPTVSGHGITVEPWILDYEGDLYGREITLEFRKFLRPERKFANLEALTAEIHENARQTRQLLEEL